MSRIKGAMRTRKRHKKILKLAKGYFGGKSKLFRIANQAVMKSLLYAYRDRRARKRDFRKLWITRINAAARINGISYSRLINGLRKTGVALNRKVLAEMAINDSEGFAMLAERAKSAV